MVQIDVDFRYWSNGQQLPLPDWGNYYLGLGAAIAQVDRSNRRLVAALAVPTRSQAAVLTAAGVVISGVKAIAERHQDPTSDHFNMLCSLHVGTPVIFRTGTRTDKGVIAGTRLEQGDGKARVGVQTQSRKGGGLTTWIPSQEADRVQVSFIPWGGLPVNPDKARDSGTSRSDFVAQVFQGEGLLNFATKSVLDCAILGSVGLLVREARDIKLSVGALREVTSAGTLHDLLRVRRLLTKGEPFRTEFFPVSKAENSKLSDGNTPHVVVFDGALGFLKWRHYWAHSKWLAILDRTEPRFEEAVQVINEEYLHRIDVEDFGIAGATPAAVDVVSFTVAK